MSQDQTIPPQTIKNLSSDAKIIVLSAPSGAGKTSLTQRLIADHGDITIAVSHTTRTPREGEVDGRDYHFVSHADFEAMMEGSQFLEYAQVFGNYYGTSVASVNDCLSRGQHVILEIDWQGAQKVRQTMPQIHSVFILPPSYQALVDRLNARGKDSAETIASRLKEAISDIGRYHEYDNVIINDSFEHALEELKNVMMANKHSVVASQQSKQKLDAFVAKLISEAV